MRVLVALSLLTAVVVLALALALPAGAQGYANIFSLNLTVPVTVQSPQYLPPYAVVNVLVTPINSSAINVTLVSLYRNGTALPSTFNLMLGVVNGSTASVGLAITGVTVTSGYQTVIINNANGYDAVVYNVTVNGVTYPGSGTYFYVTYTLPVYQPPPLIAQIGALLALAFFIAIAGRYSLRDAGIGLLIFGIIIGPALATIGVTSPYLTVLAIISWFFGIMFIIASHRTEQ